MPRDSTLREVDVWSPDTDVMISLMDIVVHRRHGAFRSTFVIVSASVVEKGLIGVHTFTGADWGGKYVCISRKDGLRHTPLCPIDGPAISASFQLMGEGLLTQMETVDDQLPE